MPAGSGSAKRARARKKPPASLEVAKLDGGRVPIAEFKAHLSGFLDRVATTRAPITITKRGRPVAVLHAPPPAGKRAKTIFGSMKGTIKILGDIVSPLDVEREVLKPDAKLDPD